MKLETAGGTVLLFCTAAALLVANSPLADAYHHLWEAEQAFHLGGRELHVALHHVINDGLMAVFFLLVGLEIKREFVMGELASARRAALPIAAALGGMIVPALIYTLLNGSGPGQNGWAIPMATDIAFALGVLTVLGPRVPLALKVFLTALAIVDDLGAVLVIALFYTSEISWPALALAAVFLGGMLLANRAGVRAVTPYLLLGVGVWAGFIASGVHATVAGVLAAMMVPASLPGSPLESAANAPRPGPPLQRIEHALQPWVTFGIVPLFAFANAGLRLPDQIGGAMLEPVTLGVVLGLLLGKPIGITLFSYLAVRLNIAEKSLTISWRDLHAASWLGGIGFTMSLFIALLAFPDPSVIDQARLGIFTASILAGTIGWRMLSSRSIAR